MKRVIEVIVYVLLFLFTTTVFMGAIFNHNLLGLAIPVGYMCIWYWYFKTKSQLDKIQEWDDIHYLHSKCCEFWYATNMYFISIISVISIVTMVPSVIYKHEVLFIDAARDVSVVGIYCLLAPIIILFITFLVSLKK